MLLQVKKPRIYAQYNNNNINDDNWKEEITNEKKIMVKINNREEQQRKLFSFLNKIEKSKIQTRIMESKNLFRWFRTKSLQNKTIKQK